MYILYILHPKAWQTEMLMIQNPAMIKLTEMIRRAGTPIVSISAEALKSDMGVTAKMSHVLFTKICEGKLISKDWKERYIIKILKK